MNNNTNVHSINTNRILEEKPEADNFRQNLTGKARYEFLPGCNMFFTHVEISETAIYKMREYVRLCAMEVGWLGTVRNIGPALLIEDVFLFEQEVSHATTAIEEADLAKYAEGLLLNPPEGWSQDDVIKHIDSIRMWGHSHVRMACNPSGQDDSTMLNFANNLRNTDTPYMIRLICNKRGDMRIDIYYYDLGIAQHEVPWCIEGFSDEPDDEIMLEMQEKLKPKTYGTYTYNPNAPHHNSKSYNDWKERQDEIRKENGLPSTDEAAAKGGSPSSASSNNAGTTSSAGETSSTKKEEETQAEFEERMMDEHLGLC